MSTAVAFRQEGGGPRGNPGSPALNAWVEEGV
jgi:hypothetical protein